MSIYRIITLALAVTMVAFSYVHQRVEIIKEGYALQSNKKCLARLVDHNSKLMYNLSRLESPRNLLVSLDTEEISFASERTRNSDVFMLTRAESKYIDSADGVIGKFLDILSVRAEAKPRRQ